MRDTSTRPLSLENTSVFLGVLQTTRGLVKRGDSQPPTRPDAETPGLGSESAGLTSCPANSEPGFPSYAGEG